MKQGVDNRDLLAALLASDPDFRREWERSEPRHRLNLSIMRAMGHLGIGMDEVLERAGIDQATLETILDPVDPLPFDDYIAVCDVLDIEVRVGGEVLAMTSSTRDTRPDPDHTAPEPA